MNYDFTLVFFNKKCDELVCGIYYGCMEPAYFHLLSAMNRVADLVIDVVFIP